MPFREGGRLHGYSVNLAQVSRCVSSAELRRPVGYILRVGQRVLSIDIARVLGRTLVMESITRQLNRLRLSAALSRYFLRQKRPINLFAA